MFDRLTGSRLLVDYDGTYCAFERSTSNYAASSGVQEGKAIMFAKCRYASGAGRVKAACIRAC